MSGSGNMSFSNITTSSNNSITAEYTVTPKLGHCEGSPASFSITVYPSPVLTSLSDAGSICSGEYFQYTATSLTSGLDYSWSRPVTPGINGGLSGSGNSSVINEVLTNSSTVPVTVSYSITMSQDQQCPRTETVTVVVNPMTDFILTNSIAEICSGATSVNLTYTTSNTPSDLRYDISFSNSARAAGFVNITNATVPSGPISVSLPSNVNSGSYSGTLKVYFSTNSGCYMEYPIEISIVPTPTLNPVSSNFYCSGTSVPEMQLRGNVSTSEITWSRTGGDVIPGLLNSGTNVFPSFVASNTSGSMLTANYTVTMTSYGLTGLTCSDTETFSIEIAPDQVVNSIDDIEKCNGDALSINFSGSGQVYEWSKLSGSSTLGIPQSGTGNISVASLTNTTINVLRAEYSVRPKFVHPVDNTKVCYGSEQRFNISVYPTPTLTTPVDLGSICSGDTFNYTASSATSGVIFSWTRASIPGINGGSGGTGNSEVISEVLNNSSNIPVTVVYEYTLSTQGSCPTTVEVRVTVNPTVDFVLDNPQYVLCSGSATTIDMDYTSGNNPSDLSYTISFSDAARGVGFVNINNPLPLPASPIVVNLPANTIAGNYTGTLSVRYSGSNSCIGHYNFEIIVVSQPSLNTIQDMVYCNGTTVPALVFNGIGGGVINWSHTSGDAIPGLSTSGYNQIPSFNAVNTGLTSLVANYSVTMTTSYGSVTCTDTKTFSITVEPSPVVNPVGSVTICNGAPLNISFSGTGNSYSWSRESGAVISGLTVGTGNISLAAVNNPGTTDITTQIKVIPQSLTGTCSGNEERFTVTVLPSPVLTSVTSAGSICSGTMFEYTATSSTGGVLFSWTRAANAAINGNIAGSGNSEHISEILTSTSESPVNVDYIVTMNLGNGCSYTETVTVSVSPEVDFNLSGSSYSACSNNSSIELLYTTTAGNLSDLRYTIVFSDAARGVGFQNVGETTMTTGGITVSLPANGMAGTYQGTLEVGYDGYMDCKRSYPFTITIYTQPEISPVTTVPYCDGVQVPSLQFRGNIENVYIEWSRDLSSDAIPGLSDSGTSYMPQFTATNTTSAPLTADYKVIMLVGDNNVSCADTLDFSLTIIQRQTVNGVSEQNLCNGDPLQISFSGNGDSFVWSKVSGSNIPGLTTTGSGDISLAAVNNTTTNVLSAQYKVVPTSSNGSCTGVNEQFWIHVYPTPVFTTALVANPICSGETFNYTARSSTSNINYSWVRTSDPSINGGSSSSGMDSDISEILLNTSNVPVTVNYVFTLDQNAICDDEITVSVTVNPVSTFGLTRNRYAVCFDETSIDMEYALGDSYAMDYSIVYGSEARNAGFTNVAFTQIGSSITISLPSNPIAGIYTGTIRLRYTGTTAEECIKEENFTIIINEQPVIYPIYVPPAYCNGEIISERSFPNNISSSTIRWVQTNSVDIGLPVTSGQTTMPLFRAVNNTTSASTAEFKVYMTYRNEGIECVDSAAFSITVEPTPTVNTIEDQYICNLGDLSVTFTGTSVNEFRWSKVEGNTISTIPSSGTGNMVYSGLQNNTNSPVSATYQVVPVSSSGVCTGSEETFRITLYPSASLSSTLTPPDICCMGTFDYTATTTIQGVDFSWERLPVSGIIGGSTGTGNGSHIYETLTNMTDPRTHVDVEYVITMSQNNSTCVDKDTVVVRVNPAARLIFDSYVKTICQGVNEVRYNLNFESGVNYSDVKYNVIFSDQARLVGFRNINDQVFTGTEIVIPIPSGVYEGNYTASVISWFDGYDGCTREYEIEIKVVGQPELMTIDNGYYCHGEVVPSRNFYGNMTENVIFEWTRQVGSDVISGLSARSTGPMPQFVANNSTSAMQSATYQVVMLHFGEGLTCSDTLDFTISIEPEQRVDAIDNIELCSGDQLEVIFSGDAGEYQWRRESGNRNLIADQNGTGDMDYIVSNTTTSVQSAIFSVTPVSTSGLGQCVGTSEVFTVTVYPQPVLSSILTADPICSGERFQYSAASYTPGVQFSWTRAAITGINNGQAGSGNSGIINETLANVTSAAIDVVYTVTLSIGPDCDYTEDVTVTVNPVVDFRLDNPLYTVCLGTDHIEMTYTTANTPADLEYSIEFSPSAIGVGFQNVPYTIISSSTLTVDLPVNTMAGTYTGTMRVRFGSHPLCVNEYSFIVTISEQPQINFVASMEYCNGESTTPIVFTGNTTNVIYYWSHDGSSDVIPGLSLNGYGNIPSFIASNTTGAAITATYTVRMSNISNLGCYDETTFNISILPTPGVDFVEDAHICNAEELAIDFTGTGTEYRWVKVSGSTIPGLNAQGTGNIYISSVVNNTNQIISAVYKVTAHSSVCTGLSEEFGISVYPTPNLSSNADAGQICSGETFAYQAQTLTEDIVITWVRTADPDINAGAPASGNNESISEILTSSSDNPVTVEYVFTLTQGPCSVERTVTVVVNPVPEIEFRYMNYVCANASEVTIPYTTTQTTPKEYIVTFSQEANNAGFLNMPSFIPLTGDLNISIPQYIPHGIYNATVTVRTISCTGTYPVAIYVHQPVSIIEQPESILNICEDLFDIHFEVTATGDSLEYQWYHNGVAIPGADESSYTATYYQGMEGQYYVEVSNMCETIYSNTVEVKPSEILVDIKWEDVLYINNAKDEYVGFQWYKDGVAIPEGGNSQYYTDVNGLDGFYHVVCYYADGITVESCPKEFHTARITSASLYPNPAERGTEVNVELSSDVDVQDMVIVIYDAMGKIVSQYKVNTYNPVIQAPLTPGNYNIHIYHNNGSRETISTKRLIVK
jgi:hypothetical protein